MSETIVLAPKAENKCSGCGGSADAGMLLTFEQDNVQRKIVGKFVMGPRYQGGGGMLHGGIIAMLMDEAMGKSCRFRNALAVTADMTIDYLRLSGRDESRVTLVEAYAKAQGLFHTAADPDRLWGLALLPPDVEDAIDEMRRVAGKPGIRGVVSWPVTEPDPAPR